MLNTLTLPQLPELQDQTALLEDWLIAEGETVRKGQALLQISIDKAILDVHAVQGGTLRKQYARRGDRVSAGSPLGLVGPAHAVVPVELQHAPAFTIRETVQSKPLPASPVRLPREGAPPMSPRARRRARELLVPLQAIDLPGGGRRINEKDVQRAAHALAAIPADEPARKEAYSRGIDLRDVAPQNGALTAENLLRVRASPLRLPAERSPLTAQRRHILEQALTAHEAVPQTECQIVIRCDPLFQYREELQKKFTRREMPSLNDLFLALYARILAAERFRLFRAVTDGADLIVRGQVDITFNIALDGGGSISPVLHAADRLSLRDVAAATRDLNHRAAQKKLRTQDLQGGVATLCNLSNSTLASGRELVRAGQTATLFIPAPQLRPTVLPEGLVGFRTTWLMTLSTDRRLIDPTLAADFLGEIKRSLEAPGSVLNSALG